MKLLIAVGLVVASLAAPLAAGSFKTTATGYIRSDRGLGLQMAIASAEADPLWGWDDEDTFKAWEKKEGPLPNVTVEGSGYTNSKGKFLFNVTVSWDDAGTMPKKTYRNKDGEDVEYVSVPVIFKATADGYAASKVKGRVNEGFESQANFMMKEAVVLKGGVVLAEGRKFMPNLKLALVRRAYNNNGLVEDVRFEFSTDKDGYFEATGDDLPTGSLVLKVAGNDYAFEPGSTAWRSITLRGGTQDLGILPVVPGGSVSFSAVDADTGESVRPFYGSLQSTDESMRFQTFVNSDADGVVHEQGIPAGTYRMKLTTRGHYAPEVGDVVITPGQVTDLGTIRCEPERELEIVAFGPSGGLARYTVSMIYLGDNPPPARRPFRDNEQIRAGATLTAENTTVRGLFSGEWQINVKADGYAEYSDTVTLPADGPLKVTLEEACTIEYSIEDGAGNALSGHWAYALLHDSPGYEKMAAMSTDELQAYSRNGMVLPSGAYRKAYRGNRFENLPSGTYLLLGDGGRWNLLVTADDIEVKPGKTVKAVMLPKPGKLTISVTDGGRSKANYSFYLRFPGDRQPALKLTTDRSGVVEHEVTFSGSPYVLTESENEWVSAFSGNDMWSVLSDETFPGRQTQMQVAHEKEYAFEIGDPEQVFVRVKPGLQEGQSIKALTLNRLDGERFSRRTSFRSAMIGDEFCFVCVPQGKYSVEGLVEAPGSRGWFSSEVSVSKLHEQTIKVKVELYRLTVKLKLADSIGVNDVRCYLRRAVSENYWRDDPQMLVPDEDGSITFECLSPAEYHLFIRVYDDGNVLVNAQRESIEVEDNETVSVSVTDKVGTLAVQIEGNPVRSQQGVGSSPTIYLLNKAGKLVPIGDPSLLDDINRYSFSLPGVPVGTYTVIVAAPGLQAYEIEEVKIEKGKTTSVKATPERAASLVVKCTNLYFDYGTTINWSYEDAEGNPLELYLPAGNISSARMGNMKGDGGVMEFTNLTPAVKQVRISVEGYEDIVIKLDLKPGDVITKDVKGEKQ